MYSVVLMMALASTDAQPAAIFPLFRGARSGCGGESAAQASYSGCGGNGAGLFSGRRERHGLLYRLRHRSARSGGCGGGGNEAVSYSRTESYSRMPVVGVSTVVEQKMPDPTAAPAEPVKEPTPPQASKCNYKVGDHVRHVGGPSFHAGTGKIASVFVKPDGTCSYQILCDRTGRLLPVRMKELGLTPISAAPASPQAKRKILGTGSVVLNRR